MSPKTTPRAATTSAGLTARAGRRPRRPDRRVRPASGSPVSTCAAPGSPPAVSPVAVSAMTCSLSRPEHLQAAQPVDAEEPQNVGHGRQRVDDEQTAAIVPEQARHPCEGPAPGDVHEPQVVEVEPERGARLTDPMPEGGGEDLDVRDVHL